MANTTFTGPVISTNGFQGDVTGSVTGAVYVATLLNLPLSPPRNSLPLPREMLAKYA